MFSVSKSQHGGGNRQQQQSSPGRDQDAAWWKTTGTTLQFHPRLLSVVFFCFPLACSPLSVSAEAIQAATSRISVSAVCLLSLFALCLLQLYLPCKECTFIHISPLCRRANIMPTILGTYFHFHHDSSPLFLSAVVCFAFYLLSHFLNV